MTRRTALSLLSSAALARADVRFRAYSRCVPNLLTALAGDAYERRRSGLSAIRSPEQVRQRQQWARKTFWELTGGIPERTPLNTRVTGSFERQAYRVEKLVYESQPGFHVTALLYIPKTHTPPFPGVLFQCGHSLNGKAMDPYQKCCQALASLGYLVLAFDPAGQGERTYYPEQGSTTTRLRSADDEHDRAGRLLMLAGDTITRLQTWDAIRSLDVLASHPQVDPKRLASTGQSGGATITMFLAAVDDRLAAAAVSSGNTENFACAEFLSPGSVDDAEQNFINSAPAGFDRWDTLYPFAPRPLLIQTSARDYFGTYSPNYFISGREEYENLKRIYALLGKPDAISSADTPMPHALGKDLRLQIYAFFDKYLKGGSGQGIDEPAVSPEPESVLNVGASGNAVRDFAGRGPADLARKRLSTGSQSARPRLSLARTESSQPKAALQSLARVTAEQGTVEAVEVPVDRHVWAPGYLFWPAEKPKDILLILEPHGRTAHWREGDLYPQLAAAGHLVAAFDLRGIGDLSPEVSSGNQFYTRPHATEEAYAWASLILGKPLLWQRVSDIRSIVTALTGSADSRLSIAALGHLTVPALLAASQDPRVGAVYCVNEPLPFRRIVETDPDDFGSFSNFVTDAANTADLPGLRAQLGKRYIAGRGWSFAELNSI